MSIVCEFRTRPPALEAERLIVGSETPGRLQRERWAGKLGSRGTGSGGGLGGLCVIVEGMEVGREGFRTVYGWARRTHSVVNVISANEDDDDRPGSPRDIAFRKRMGEQFDDE